MTRLPRAPALLLAAVLAACSDGPQQGRVVGDVFVALASGEEMNFSGVPVHLLPDSAVIDSTLARVCAQRTGRAAGADTSAARAWAERQRLLRGFVRRTVVADAGARFAMDSVPAGKYRLWADTTVAGDRWSWLEPVRVPAGDSIRVNLSNENTDENPFRCPW